MTNLIDASDGIGKLELFKGGGIIVQIASARQVNLRTSI